VDYLKPFTTDVPSATMISSSMPIIGFQMEVNAYRHINIAWKRKLCPEATSLLESSNDLETVDALQSGHSRPTENRIYGLSAEALAHAEEDVLPLDLDCSTHMQVQMEVVPGESHPSSEELV
jgi:hypothetical protein